MKQQLKRVVSLCSALTIVCSATPALAYGYGAHSRIVEEAVYVLQVEAAANTAPPSGVAQADWDAFINVAKLTPSSLSGLRTGLPTSKPVSDGSLSPLNDDPPGSEGFPFNGKDGTCSFATMDNLANAGEFRVKEFPYTTRRSAPCALQSETADPRRPLQSLLGWHAGTIDDHLQDVVMWYRPTNSVLFTFITQVATRALEIVAGAILLPFVCVFKFFTGGSCGVSDGQDLVNQVNPVDELESLIPGFGSVYSGDYTGLWHFIDVGAGTGQYSDIRGMLYEGAGDDHPGIVDIGLMAIADVSGLSLKPQTADGDNIYGQYDRVSRDTAGWQSSTIGHLEWSPVDHLAAYGWDRFKNHPTSADGLGWVLHALGDAGEPHHVTGTTSWGHRPYEEYVESHLSSMLLLELARNDTSVPAGALEAQHRRVLELAYTYFNGLASGGLTQPAGVGAIEALVQQVARSTYSKVHGQSWVFNDSASLNYALGGNHRVESISEYIGDDAQMTDIIESSVGAAVAFLMYAGKFAVDPGLSPNIACAANTHFEAPATCAPGAAPPPSVFDGGVCSSDGVCGGDAGVTTDAGTGAPCSTSADCVVGTCSGGLCSQDCSTTPCGKGTCVVGLCCAEDSSPCAGNSDCCGASLCATGICQAAPPK